MITFKIYTVQLVFSTYPNIKNDELTDRFDDLSLQFFVLGCNQTLLYRFKLSFRKSQGFIVLKISGSVEIKFLTNTENNRYSKIQHQHQKQNTLIKLEVILVTLKLTQISLCILNGNTALFQERIQH